MTTKEFFISTDCMNADLEKMVNAGWSIHFMQFMPDNKLNVVFVRDVKPAAPTQPYVVMPVADPVRSVALTSNKPRFSDTRPITRVEVKERRERANAEVVDILQRYAQTQKEIDQEFKPFILGVQP